MKQIIKSHSNPSILLVYSIKDDYILSTHGLYGIIAKGQKYVLSVSDKLFTFAAGRSRWTSTTSFAGLLQECLNHPDVKVFIFDDLKEYAEWILKDVVAVKMGLPLGQLEAVGVGKDVADVVKPGQAHNFDDGDAVFGVAKEIGVAAEGFLSLMTSRNMLNGF